MRSNITEIPHPGKLFVVKCLQGIQISLFPGQQDNSNALPLGHGDQSNPCPMPSLPPSRLDIDRCISCWSLSSIGERRREVEEWRGLVQIKHDCLNMQFNGWTLLVLEGRAIFLVTSRLLSDVSVIQLDCSNTIYSSSAIFPLWNNGFVLIIYLREPILYKPAGFFWASSPWESR